ncbi:Holliday junction resolvase RuvX [Halanaerobium salsuginis]|jgi:RNase H-fold protein (predicted Holliday junction resolvase)|uniref:RNase H-fold protein, predicted Holliday junction resolvase n=1 Tax=Halanaerobium salsuginis TaxID=29563 RepID=A0A1I4FP97_9FIRM|nr:Holliday junction resolvase RuvX [Halanaerobium salsuginis]SFL18646.1 RNase H-fold protein, predicted Holliday junction resolvase [Halanaerobium salsuginis]
MDQVLLAFDPGSHKIGAAVVDFNAQLQEKTILSQSELTAYLAELAKHYQIVKIIIGNGTTALELLAMLNNELPEQEIELVEESYTTEAAQARYLAEKPMSNYEKLLRKFISWKVKKPLDDYAALIIAEKYLKKLDKEPADKYNSE